MVTRNVSEQRGFAVEAVAGGDAAQPISVPTGYAGPAARRSLRSFGLLVGGVLLGLVLLMLLRHRSGPMLYVLSGTGGLLVMLAVLAPRLLAPVQRVWMRLAALLGWFNTRLLLAIVFFLLLTPIALILRLVGRDPLDRRREPGRKSYWRTRRDESPPPDHYKRQF